MYATCFALLPWLLFSHPRQQLPWPCHSLSTAQWWTSWQDMPHSSNACSEKWQSGPLYILRTTLLSRVIPFLPAPLSLLPSPFPIHSAIFVNNELVLCFLCHTQVWIYLSYCRGNHQPWSNMSCTMLKVLCSPPLVVCMCSCHFTPCTISSIARTFARQLLFVLLSLIGGGNRTVDKVL